MFEIILLLVLAALVMFLLWILGYELKNLGLGMLLIVFTAMFMGAFMVFEFTIPGTHEATIQDAGSMIRECEANLPRNQRCVIDLQVRPADAHDPE